MELKVMCSTFFVTFMFMIVVWSMEFIRPLNPAKALKTKVFESISSGILLDMLMIDTSVDRTNSKHFMDYEEINQNTKQQNPPEFSPRSSAIDKIYL